MKIDITTLFVCVDDFCKLYESSIKSKALPSCKTRQRQGYLSLSEMLLIEVLYHFSHYKNFKYFYLHDILGRHRSKFRKLPCYDRFVASKKKLFMPFIDKILLTKRFIIETIFGVMKTDFNLEHLRRRSPINAFVSILACLVAYSYKTDKPKIRAFLLQP